MILAMVALAALSLLGHAAFWIGINNRWHGTGFPRKVVKSVTPIFYSLLTALPPLLAWYYFQLWRREEWSPGRWPPLDAAGVYVLLAAAYGAVHFPLWTWWRLRRLQLPAAVTPGPIHIVDVCERLGSAPTRSPRTRLFCQIPFNQLWELQLNHYELEFANLPRSLDGLTVCHLSDLHFSGRIEREYFDQVVEVVNAMQVDVVALTGDICDHARYIDWVPDTLGKLHARLAKVSILGNHDLRTRDVTRLREAMAAADFVDVGGRSEPIAGESLLVAGNERPWFRRSIPRVDRSPPDTFKLLLSHTPDQFAWAQSHGFDLMLAGHTHGGQIRFPLIGAVVCPSRYGTRYSDGFFHAGDTLLHVSRGTASLFPYRMNCRPEITRLVLRRA